jgi:hypothetical protein
MLMTMIADRTTARGDTPRRDAKDGAGSRPDKFVVPPWGLE